MKLFRTTLLYVVGGCLKSPKPLNMSLYLSTNINYIIHTIFMIVELNMIRLHYFIHPIGIILEPHTTYS